MTDNPKLTGRVGVFLLLKSGLMYRMRGMRKTIISGLVATAVALGVIVVGGLFTPAIISATPAAA